MFAVMKLIRGLVGGKTELGIIISVVALVVFALPVMPWFGAVQLIAFFKVVGIFTGVSLLSRIEDKKGFLEALKSLFTPARKT